MLGALHCCFLFCFFTRSLNNSLLSVIPIYLVEYLLKMGHYFSFFAFIKLRNSSTFYLITLIFASFWIGFLYKSQWFKIVTDIGRNKLQRSGIILFVHNQSGV